MELGTTGKYCNCCLIRVKCGTGHAEGGVTLLILFREKPGSLSVDLSVALQWSAGPALKLMLMSVCRAS